MSDGSAAVQPTGQPGEPATGQLAEQAATGRHRVVVVGGGFGGLNVVRALRGADVDVTVVDRTNHHLFQPLLYQVAAGLLPPGLIAPALRSIIKRQENARALLADVHDIDFANKVVQASGPDGRPIELPYDTLVVAAGATHSYFGKNQFAEFAPGMKTVEDARYIRDGILSKFEIAEMTTDPQERREWLTFVVIGAGPTGVELVGQIAELAHTVLPREYRSVHTDEARIILLEGAPSVLPPFKPVLQRYTQHQLEEMGVEVRLNTLAVDMDHASITVKGPDGIETIRCRSRIWAAGVQASPLAKLLAKQAGVDTDRAGRIPVNPDCTVPNHPEVFAIGDMVSLNKLPGVAQPALQEGKYVGKVIRARLAGQAAPRPFKYFDKGSMATIGYKSAVADAFGVKVTGILAYLMWAFVHVAYLIGWGNRIGTMYTWFRALVLTKSRGHRVITFNSAQTDLEGRRPSGRLPAILPAETFAESPSSRPADGGAAAESVPSGSGRPAHHEVGRDDQLALGDGRPFDAVDGPRDGERADPLGVLRDGGQVDVGQPGEAAVVVADDADVARHDHAGAVQDVEHARGAAAVEDGDGGRPRVGGEERACGRGAVVLREPAGQDADRALEAVAAHRVAVPPAAVGGAGRTAAVDVRDAAVAEGDEVVDGLVQALVVGGADHVEGPVAGRAGHHDHRQGGRRGRRSRTWARAGRAGRAPRTGPAAGLRRPVVRRGPGRRR
jgi:NADH dehydrogenase